MMLRESQKPIGKKWMQKFLPRSVMQKTFVRSELFTELATFWLVFRRLKFTALLVGRASDARSAIW